MKVNIEATNFNVDNKLISFINEKLKKLDLFYYKIVFIDVFLKVQKTSEKENKVIEVRLSLPGEKIMLKKESKTFEEGISESVKALIRKVKQRKEKQRSFS